MLRPISAVNLFLIITLIDTFGWLSITQNSQLLAVAQNNKNNHKFDKDPLDFCMPVNHRVCLDEETRRCEPNYLKRPTITLTAGTSDSSIYISWVAQILLAEVLKFPTWVNGDGLGSHNFYEEGTYRMNQPRRFTFDAIMNADKSPDLSCSVAYKDSLPVPTGLLEEPICQVSYLIFLLYFVILFLKKLKPYISLYFSFFCLDLFNVYLIAGCRWYCSSTM